MHKVSKSPYVDVNALVRSSRGDHEYLVGMVREECSRGSKIASLSVQVIKYLRLGGFTDEEFARYVDEVSEHPRRQTPPEEVPEHFILRDAEFSLESTPSEELSTLQEGLVREMSPKRTDPHLTWREDPAPNFLIIPNYAFNHFEGHYFASSFSRDELDRRLTGLKKNGCVAHHYSDLSTGTLGRYFNRWQVEIHDKLVEVVQEGKCSPEISRHFDYTEWRRINHKDFPSISS